MPDLFGLKVPLRRFRHLLFFISANQEFTAIKINRHQVPDVPVPFDLIPHGSIRRQPIQI